MYKYRFRPCYGSDKRLIEFSIKSNDEKFMDLLLNAISSINPKVEDIKDLWMNDEVLIELMSDEGGFILSKDVWDSVFIMSDTNQSVISKIDHILRNDSRFESEKLDDEKYRQPGSSHNVG